MQDFRYVIQKEVSQDDLLKQDKINWQNILNLNSNIRGIIVRKLRIAKNMVASANTDGISRITINYELVKGYNKGVMIYILLHEYSHDNDTVNSDEHGYEFYQKFYDLTKENTHLLRG